MGREYCIHMVRIEDDCDECVTYGGPDVRENACNLAARTHNTLANLLARIHRDGGHYMTQHGAEKAAEDADQIVAELFADRDRLAGEVERLTKHVSRLEHANDTAFSEVARLTSELAAANELLSIHSGQWVEEAVRRAGEGEA